MTSARESQVPQSEKLQPILGKNHAYYFLLALLFLAVLGLYSIVEPYLHCLILGIILALVFRPIHLRIERIVRHRQNIAAFLSSARIIPQIDKEKYVLRLKHLIWCPK